MCAGQLAHVCLIRGPADARPADAQPAAPALLQGADGATDSTLSATDIKVGAQLG